MEKNTIITAAIVAVVAFGGGTLFGKYLAGPTLADLKTMSAEERRTALADIGGFGGGAGGRMGGQGRAGNRGTGGGAAGDQFVTGEVLSSDATSITLKLQDGGSKIVYTSADTKITKSAPGSAADIKSQTQLVVTGTPGDAGSITAKTIQIRDAAPTK